jgi:anti-sigma B factor antagonist
MADKHGSHWMEREDFGDVTVVRLKVPTALDDDIIQAVFDPIYRLVDGMGRNRLVLNLGAASTLPSMALGKLVMLNRKVQASNGRLALCNLSSIVEQILETTHLRPLFHISKEEAEALKSFS